MSTLIERDVLELASIERRGDLLKLAFVDTGIASHLIGQDAARLGEPGGAAGPMMENFVVMELARQLTWSKERARLYNYRTKDRLEVEAVFETPDGRVVDVEVMAGATVRTEDLSGLRNLTRLLGDRFMPGFVLYINRRSRSARRSGRSRWTPSGASPPDAKSCEASSPPAEFAVPRRASAKPAPSEDFTSFFNNVKSRLFDKLPDDTWFHPGHGDDSTLGKERPNLPE